MPPVTLFYYAIFLQSFLMLMDEFSFHFRRELPRFERIGHPLDTLSVLVPFAYMSYVPCPGYTPTFLAVSIIFSCFIVTKDEWIHSRLSSPGERWVHSVLFVIHPVILILGWLIWRERGPSHAHYIQLGLVSLCFLYQLIYWNVFADPPPKTKPEINNDLYHDLGERWYTAKDDPVALLRAEGKIKHPWVKNAVEKHSSRINPREVSVLDVGCGAGFLANYLARESYTVQGVDLSESSLKIAKAHDETKSVIYLSGNAYTLPAPDQFFDVVTCMDFLEHVDEPGKVIAEISRVLKPGGLFIFHTFNRNLLSHLIIIKGIEWFVKNTPPHMHLIELFIKPSELKIYCEKAGLKTDEIIGIRPKISWAFFKMLFTGSVPDNFGFKFTRSTPMGYIGTAEKKVPFS